MAPTVDLPAEVLADAAISAFDNAVRLLDDAHLLLAAGRWPTAHSLAVLALEECGKHIMCVASLARLPNETPYTVARFLRRLRRHDDKLANAQYMLDALSRDDPGTWLGELLTTVRSLGYGKMLGLYVDIDPATPEVLVPESIAEAEASRLVANVGGLLEWLRPIVHRPRYREMLLQTASLDRELPPPPDDDLDVPGLVRRAITGFPDS
ncbi:MAG: AbiV family abortive infection protein [Chloroflexi bacterium]|nr:AbiV family abortive infection protein [Chloroflexota bacterium]